MALDIQVEVSCHCSWLHSSSSMMALTEGRLLEVELILELLPFRGVP